MNVWQGYLAFFMIIKSSRGVQEIEVRKRALSTRNKLVY